MVPLDRVEFEVDIPFVAVCEDRSWPSSLSFQSYSLRLSPHHMTLDSRPVELLTGTNDLRRELSGVTGEPIRVIGYRPMSLIGTRRSLGPQAQIEFEAFRPVRVIKHKVLAQLPERS